MASSLSAFLGEIGRHQLLTPEQELMLGRKVQAMVALNERCAMAGVRGKPAPMTMVRSARCGWANGLRIK